MSTVGPERTWARARAVWCSGRSRGAVTGEVRVQAVLIVRTPLRATGNLSAVRDAFRRILAPSERSKVKRQGQVRKHYRATDPWRATPSLRLAL
jgi:hypothetical protein